MNVTCLLMVACVVFTPTLKMEALHSSGTSFTSCLTAQLHIQKITRNAGCNHLCERLKFSTPTVRFLNFRSVLKLKVLNYECSPFERRQIDANARLDPVFSTERWVYSYVCVCVCVCVCVRARACGAWLAWRDAPRVETALRRGKWCYRAVPGCAGNTCRELSAEQTEYCIAPARIAVWPFGGAVERSEMLKFISANVPYVVAGCTGRSHENKRIALLWVVTPWNLVTLIYFQVENPPTELHGITSPETASLQPQT
jgi:hypothetical protein